MLQQEELSHRDIFNLIRELLVSIREINRRLQELKWVVKESLCNEEGRRKIVKRIENLNNTKMCFIYSVHDLRDRAEIALEKRDSSLRLKTLYQELKNL